MAGEAMTGLAVLIYNDFTLTGNSILYLSPEGFAFREMMCTCVCTFMCVYVCVRTFVFVSVYVMHSCLRKYSFQIFF